MKTVDNAKIAELLKEAAASPRRRTHLNLHESTDEPAAGGLPAGYRDRSAPPHDEMGAFHDSGGKDCRLYLR